MAPAALPLFEAALLVARDEYPDLDVRAFAARMQAHAAHLRIEVDAIDAGPLKMQAINRHLFEEAGYTGDQANYYDPRNSYLSDVIERRLGNPISLAIVQCEVARRLGVPLAGISFPGHFLVRLPVGDGMLVMDPFNGGRPLDIDELRMRAAAHLGGTPPDDDALAALLRPATARATVMRILRNLHAGYRETGDWARAARCADRLLTLHPGACDALRDRGLAYLALGYVTGARNDLVRYLQAAPEADDADAIRERLVEAGLHRHRAH
ncbi:tetratricopeptide repeat protein [Luteimonas sp. gir]|uniref:SirB1 family protein n=1 Tax=Luteimonas sp. gir TaxID=3127960 RepID=UPI003075E01D